MILILRKWWLGTELNRRHKDFQSSALPTELPSQPFINNNLRIIQQAYFDAVLVVVLVLFREKS